MRTGRAKSKADTSSTPGEPPWAAWIEQQRELLKQQPAADGSQPSGPFKVGEQMLNAWRSAWAATGGMQSAAGQGIAELLAKLPPIGPAREQVAAWRELAAIQAECQHLEQELQTVLMGVQRDALNLLEQCVRERGANQQPLASYRELYDLWVDCGEQIYAKLAHSDAYAKLQAQFGNASIKLKARQQQAMEQTLKQFDLPTRSELNSVHLQLRQLKQRLATLEQGGAATAVEPEVTAPAKRQPPASTARASRPPSAASKQPARKTTRKSR